MQSEQGNNLPAFNLEHQITSMQRYNKETLDARTFQEIWNSLSPEEQSDLRYELTKNGECSRTSLYNWSKGVAPINVSLRRKVASTMGRILGLRVSHTTLFPLNRR